MSPTLARNPLKTLRDRANLSQESMAKRVGWSQTKVSKFEGRLLRDLSLGDVEDYCRALGLEFDFSINEPERLPCGAKVQVA